MYNLLTTNHMDALRDPSSHPARPDAERSFANEVSIRVASGKLDREECFLLRRNVFVGERGFPYESDLDGYDADSVHFLAIYRSWPVATARLADKGDGVGKIGKVAVLPNHRKQGIGTDLMWFVMGAGFRHFHTLVLDSPMDCIPFFENLGFETDGEMAPIFGVWHMRMFVRR